jgi:hypothetical protein
LFRLSLQIEAMELAGLEPATSWVRSPRTGEFNIATISGKLGKVLMWRYSPANVTRKLDVGYEQTLRRALANQIIRRSPEAQSFYREMPKQARSWRAAARQALSDPRVADRVCPFTGGIGNTLRNLPQYQLAYPHRPKHPERALYADYGRKAALLQYLGYPKRKLRNP